jgi:hypothetical protein
MAVTEPYRAVVLVHRSHGDARAFLHRERAWSHEARGDFGALSYRVMASVPRGMWQYRSPLLAGDAHGALGHGATPEPFPCGWQALCHGACGNTGALFWRMACFVPRGTWQSQSPLALGMNMFCAQGYPVCRVPTVALSPTSGEATNP